MKLAKGFPPPTVPLKPAERLAQLLWLVMEVMHKHSSATGLQLPFFRSPDKGERSPHLEKKKSPPGPCGLKLQLPHRRPQLSRLAMEVNLGRAEPLMAE